jgi:predicted RNA-binding protein with PUA domain
VAIRLVFAPDFLLMTLEFVFDGYVTAYIKYKQSEQYRFRLQQNGEARDSSAQKKTDEWEKIWVGIT